MKKTYCAECGSELSPCPNPLCEGKKFDRLTEEEKQLMRKLSDLLVIYGGEALLKVTGAILRQTGAGAYNVGLHLDILSKYEW